MKATAQPPVKAPASCSVGKPTWVATRWPCQEKKKPNE